MQNIRGGGGKVCKNGEPGNLERNDLKRERGGTEKIGITEQDLPHELCKKLYELKSEKEPLNEE